MERSVLKLSRGPGALFGIPAFARLALPLAALLCACATTPTAEDAAPPASGAAPPSRAGGVVAPPGEGSGDSLFDLPPRRVPAPELPPRFENLWARISSGLRLRQYYERPEVREQMRLFARRPDYFEQVGERARPFLHNIVEQIEQRGMPMEIALMPFVESGFNPYARSPRAAIGPWQFMAGTGRSLGLRIDDWFDGRRDPIRATTAALDYLEIQWRRFEGNWLLAFAAYNSGPATVSRAVRAVSANPRDVDFWELPLPVETRTHVPRILALAGILAGGGETEFTLPDIANEEALRRVKIGGGASLVLAAELAGLEPEIMRGLNPGFRRWWTPLDGGPDFVHLPTSNADALRRALRQNPNAAQIAATRYRIQAGDTLGGIARAALVSVDVLRSRNGLDDDFIVAGDYLWIPGPGPEASREFGGMAPDKPAPLATESRRRTHIVQPGDSLWAIARRHGLDVGGLARLNRIAPSDLILPGQRLLLSAGVDAAIDIYRIRPGDTLGRIARRRDIPLEDILRWNSLEADHVIFPGQMLRVAPPTDELQ